MARHLFIPPLIPSGNDFEFGGDGGINTYRRAVNSLRNLFRSGDGEGYTSLNVALNGARWKVSDIVTAKNGNPELMYAFLLRDISANVEYAFIYSGKAIAGTSNTSKSTWAQIVGSGRDFDYVQAEEWTRNNNNSDSFSANHRPDLCLYMNTDPSTSSWGRYWGFDNATEMTFSGGDYKDVMGLCDPRTTWTTHWLPVGPKNPHGIYWHDNSNPNVEYCYHQTPFVICDSSHSLARYQTVGTGGRVQFQILSKNLFNPITPGDVYTQGLAHGTTYSSTTSWDGTEYFWAAGFDNLGNPEPLMRALVHRQFNRNNEMVGSAYKWRSVQVSSNTFDKGWFNSNLIAEIGAYGDIRHWQRRFAHPSPSEPMCRYLTDCALMWAPNVPALPVSFPSLR